MGHMIHLNLSVMANPLVTSKHLLTFGVDISSANLISKIGYNKINERSKFDTSDILISMIGTVGTIPYIVNLPTEFAIKNVRLFRASKNPPFSLYVLGCLKSKHTMHYIEKAMQVVLKSIYA